MTHFVLVQVIAFTAVVSGSARHSKVAAAVKTRDPTSYVAASSQVGVTNTFNTKLASLSDYGSLGVAAAAEQARTVFEKVSGDAGEVFLRSFIRTEAHRDAAPAYFRLMSYTWIIVAGAILAYLAKLAFYPRLKSLLSKPRKTVEPEYSSDDETADEEEEVVARSINYPPKALLPSSADARMAYEAQAYSAS